MGFDTEELGKYVEVLSGFAFKSKDFSESGIPVIKIKNINPPEVSLHDVSYVPVSFLETHSKYVLDRNDILIAMTGSHINQWASVVGRVARVKYKEKSFLNQRVGKIIVTDTEKCDENFVYYYLSQDLVKIELANIAGGAANQANISPADIKGLRIPFPSIDIQRRIGKILTAYDDLIENNKKQIKLLEEMAQRLYKEWFVDLHFPGYEDVEIVDGVPEGWRVCALSEVADINCRSIAKDYEHEYIDYIDLGSVKEGRINEKIRYLFKDAPGRAKRIAKDGDVIWGMVRPNLRSYALILHPESSEVYSTGFVVISARKVLPFSYLYETVITDAFVGYLVNCTNGAAYPAVKITHFENARILMPSSIYVQKYHNIVEHMFRKMELLDKQIKCAIDSRNRLLLRLMAGKLEV